MFEDAFDKAWRQSETLLDKILSDNQPVKKQRYRLTGYNGITFHCCVCECNDAWVVESENVFVCEHEPIVSGGGFGIRQLDHVVLVNVMQIEEVGE